MVYNALKLFMEINPDMFEECLQGFKEHRQSEHQCLVNRYERWQQLKETAIRNAGGKLPSIVENTQYPEPPPPLDESEIADVSIDLSQVAIDADVGQELDDSGVERVPNADPGLDQPYPELSHVENGSFSQSPHVRRKSVLPVDPTVLRDLQAHRSLEDTAPTATPDGP